jgi:TetR/AcrR family transcriptional regulator, mexCD-oprJ operon repressor
MICDMPQPSGAAPRQALQQRVATTILEAAAQVLVARGEQASMSDVAAAAGVARATVYRYFPNRQSLRDELASAAVRGAGDRLVSARIDEIPVLEGIGRAIRALVEVGDGFIVLARERPRTDDEEFERRVGGPIRALLERGQSDGYVRADIPSEWLTDSLIGIVASVQSSPLRRGHEDTVAAMTSMYVDGARDRRSAA